MNAARLEQVKEAAGLPVGKAKPSKRMWPWTPKVVCVKCGEIRRADHWNKEWDGTIPACSHLFFSTRDRTGIAIGKARRR